MKGKSAGATSRARLDWPTSESKLHNHHRETPLIGGLVTKFKMPHHQYKVRVETINRTEYSELVNGVAPEPADSTIVHRDKQRFKLAQ